MNRVKRWPWVVALAIAAVFGRPAIDFSRVVATRAVEAATVRWGDKLWRPRQAAVVQATSAQGDEIVEYLRRMREPGLSPARLQELDFSSERAYVQSTDTLRAQLKADLRYPPPGFERKVGPAVETMLGSDDLADYYSVRVEALPGVHTGGTYARPKRRPAGERLPLIIAAGGRGAAPPAAADGTTSFVSHSNRDLMHGALRRGYAVWSPVYIFYREGKGNDYREHLTAQAWEVGTSLPAIEIAKTVKAIDALLLRPEIDAERVAMVGMSYGGFATLYTAALDPRIRAAVVAAYFNDREAVLGASEPHGFLDWRFQNSLSKWQDPALVALVCPRALLVQSGNQDQLFPIEGARRAAPLARANYERLGVATRFRFSEFVGRHDFNGDEAWEFISNAFASDERSAVVQANQKK
ncbi:MAG: hypothetical protein EOO22_10275 [Comamonadaceae bacterium]|nr:MAG: hypothetical protein EOO22_10275 [Comamonadaceae bacterium]